MSSVCLPSPGCPGQQEKATGKGVSVFGHDHDVAIFQGHMQPLTMLHLDLLGQRLSGDILEHLPDVADRILFEHLPSSIPAAVCTSIIPLRKSTVNG